MAKSTEKKPTENFLEEAVLPAEKAPYALPPNWCWVKLKKIVRHQSGNSKLIKGKLSPVRCEGYFEAFSASGQDVFCETYEHEGAAIIVSAIGARCGKAFLADGKWSAIANTQIIYPSKAINLNYLFYIINNEDWWIKSGSAQPFVVMNESLERPFPLPPIEEQSRIVNKIDNLFVKLDEARELIQKSLDFFEDRKTALSHKAFSGDLTAEWRARNNFNDCGQNVVLGEYLHPIVNKKPDRNEEYFNYIDIDAIDNRIQKVKAPKKILVSKAPSRATREVKENDVLFSMVRPYLKNIALITSDFADCIASTGFYVCRCKDGLLPKFLFYFLCSQEVLDYLTFTCMKGDNSPSIRKNDLLGLTLNLPCVEEQREIVRILDSFFEKEDKTKELLDMLDKIDELKKCILARAFRGELGTNNPEDEPATEFLKRITEEKQI